MYLRPVHAEPNLDALRDFIRSNPLGLLTTAIDSDDGDDDGGGGGGGGFPFLQATHIPFVLDDDDDDDDDGPNKEQPPSSDDGKSRRQRRRIGTLRGHLARANPHARAMIASVERRRRAAAGDPTSDPSTTTHPSVLARPVLVTFTSPVSSYVTPHFYTATKPLTGKTVPTWNYGAVQARGLLRLHFDGGAAADAFLARQVADLSLLCEVGIAGHDGVDGRPAAWGVEDAPAGYVAAMRRAIVGVEVEVEGLEGKWKMGQELGEGDRRGVVEGFEGMGTDLGRAVAEMVRKKAPK
ncbi:transcriptional regulator PAI 2-type [Zopfochytrium polystomum]|nr:transcriptional regulator PAI 2-type [Zopfochytrium polystomum]